MARKHCLRETIGVARKIPRSDLTSDVGAQITNGRILDDLSPLYKLLPGEYCLVIIAQAFVLALEVSHIFKGLCKQKSKQALFVACFSELVLSNPVGF